MSTDTDFEVAAPYRLVRARHGTMLVNENDRFMGQAYLRYGECCEHELSLLLQLAELPGTVIEVGANMGVFTVALAVQLAREGRQMLAFEPQPVVFQQLCANLALNGLTNVQAMPYACGAEESYVTFHLPQYRRPGNFGGIEMQRGDQSDSRPGDRPRRVPCFRLDTFLSDARVSMIKIDVEGFELAVLEGARRTIARDRPLIFVENDRAESSLALTGWLLDHGYRLWWHLSPLYNPENLRGDEEDIYPGVLSLNMLCIPAERAFSAVGLAGGLGEVTEPTVHPMLMR